MAHMQNTGNIGRRNNNAERLLVRIGPGSKQIPLLPILIYPVLNLFRFVAAIQLNHSFFYFVPSFNSLYSTLSTRACQLASMIFPETPTVPQESFSSWDWMSTRTLAAVPAFSSSTRTLKSDRCIRLKLG